MPKPEKIEAVVEMTKLFQECNSFFITDYQGLNVADITILRKNLRESDVRFLVAKNTLLGRAAKEAGRQGLEEYFNGPTAVAFASNDPAVAAKILYDSYKTKERPLMKVFVVDDQLHAGEEIKRLADLPPRPILLSQLVAAIEAPLTQLVGMLDGVFRGLIGSIDALAEKKKGEE